MAQGITAPPSNAAFNYPFASSPDIVRSHQKDAYFQSLLLEKLSSIQRSLYGARFAHTYTTETRTAADLLYLSLTTLVGNRTLGEEYCDIIQVQSDLRLPSLLARFGYVLSVLVPYGLGRWLPLLRRWIRDRLETRSVQTKNAQWEMVRAYVLRNVDGLTSPSTVSALGLVTFYFTGAYYHLAKRVWGLRYIFSRRLEEHEQRGGYEVLGVLLLAQLVVQAYMHVQTMYDQMPVNAPTTSMLDNGTETSLSGNTYTSNHALYDAPVLPSAQATIGKTTHTPIAVDGRPRVDLEDSHAMQWIQGKQLRKCTLCLEGMKDPSVTTCGHVFCWTCISDWVREKSDCPLCRQSVQAQHILPLRG